MDGRLFPKTREEIVREKIAQFYLPDRTYNYLCNLLDGKANEKALLCCNSGCEVCNETLYNCLVSIREEWDSSSQSLGKT